MLTRSIHPSFAPMVLTPWMGRRQRQVIGIHHLATKQYPRGTYSCREYLGDSITASSSPVVSPSDLKSRLDDTRKYHHELETYIYRSSGDSNCGDEDSTTGHSSTIEFNQESQKDEKIKKLRKIKKTKNLHNIKRQKTPQQVVNELNQHIVGQADAKRAVAIALRNRWRRKQLLPELQKEVTPRNVLMIGPTGCGKTEIARRMAALGGAPFIKVEATKFTEVGYHGGDVDKIIRDLVEVSIILTKKQKRESLKEELVPKVEERLVELLMTGKSLYNHERNLSFNNIGMYYHTGKHNRRARESFREMLREKYLEDVYVEMDVPMNRPSKSTYDIESSTPILTSSGREITPDDMDRVNHIVAMIVTAPTSRSSSVSSSPGKFGDGGVKTTRETMSIQEAREFLLNLEVENALRKVDLKKEAIKAVEESGIVFIDEIDKICTSRDTPRSHSSDASDEGVQRDLLPLVEGTTISTKHGNVNTDFILFIASGAFHAVKPSDMLPELQGRLPIRVNLAGLTEHDLYRILTEPVANLLRQQTELLKTEGVKLKFDDDATKEIARMAALVNRTVENIGARRLHTVMERVMEEISYDAGVEGTNMEPGSIVTVTKELVQNRLKNVVAQDSDLKKYIL